MCKMLLSLETLEDLVVQQSGPRFKFHTYTIQRPVFNIWGITLTKQRDGFIFHSSCQQVRMAPIVAQNIQSSPWPVQTDTASVRFWKLNTTSWYVAADQNSWWRLYHSMYISVLVTWAFLKCKQQKTSMNLCQKKTILLWILVCLSILPIKLELSLRKGSAAGILSTLPYGKNRMKIVEKSNKVTLCGRNVKPLFVFSVIMGLPALHLMFTPH